MPGENAAALLSPEPPDGELASSSVKMLICVSHGESAKILICMSAKMLACMSHGESELCGWAGVLGVGVFIHPDICVSPGGGAAYINRVGGWVGGWVGAYMCVGVGGLTCVDVGGTTYTVLAIARRLAVPLAE